MNDDFWAQDMIKDLQAKEQRYKSLLEAGPRARVASASDVGVIS